MAVALKAVHASPASPASPAGNANVDTLEQPLKHVLDSLENVLGALGGSGQAPDAPPPAPPHPPMPPPPMWGDLHCDQECILVQTLCGISLVILGLAIWNTRRLLYYNYSACSSQTVILFCIASYVFTVGMNSLFPHLVVILTSIQHVIRAAFVYSFTEITLASFAGTHGVASQDHVEAMADTFRKAGVGQQEFHFPLLLCWGISYEPDERFLRGALQRVKSYPFVAAVLVLWKAVANDYGMMKRMRPYIGVVNLVALLVAVSGKLALDQLFSKLVLPSARNNVELRNLVYLFFVVWLGGIHNMIAITINATGNPFFGNHQTTFLAVELLLVSIVSRRCFGAPFTWCTVSPPPAHETAYNATSLATGSREAVISGGEIGATLTVLPEDIPSVLSGAMTIEAASEKIIAKNIAIDGATAATTSTPNESTPLTQPLAAKSAAPAGADAA